MNLIGVFVTKLWHDVQICTSFGVRRRRRGGDGGGDATKNIIPPKYVKFRGYNYHANIELQQQDFIKMYMYYLQAYHNRSRNTNICDCSGGNELCVLKILVI